MFFFILTIFTLVCCEKFVYFLVVDDITNAKEKENVEQVISMVTSVHTPLLILFGQDDQVKNIR